MEPTKENSCFLSKTLYQLYNLLQLLPHSHFYFSFFFLSLLYFLFLFDISYFIFQYSCHHFIFSFLHFFIPFFIISLSFLYHFFIIFFIFSLSSLTSFVAFVSLVLFVVCFRFLVTLCVHIYLIVTISIYFSYMYCICIFDICGEDSRYAYCIQSKPFVVFFYTAIKYSKLKKIGQLLQL